jgi:hypothetical protein
MRYVPDKTPHQELDSAIAKLIPECSQQEFRQLLEKATQERLRAALAQVPPPMPTAPSIRQHEQSSPPPPKRLKTPNDLEKRRHEIKESKSAIEKLEILIKIQEEVGADLTKLTNGAKRWYRRVQPILMCFQSCCGKNKHTFLEKYTAKNLQVTSFKCVHGKNHKFSTNDEL